MEDCPRCHARLETLSLGELTTISCTECGFADIPADHESNPMEYESWKEAFRRFYEE